MKKAMTLKLEEDLIRALRDRKERTGIPFAVFIRRALRLALVNPAVSALIGDREWPELSK